MTVVDMLNVVRDVRVQRDINVLHTMRSLRLLAVSLASATLLRPDSTCSKRYLALCPCCSGIVGSRAVAGNMHRNSAAVVRASKSGENSRIGGHSQKAEAQDVGELHFVVVESAVARDE